MQHSKSNVKKQQPTLICFKYVDVWNPLKILNIAKTARCVVKTVGIEVTRSWTQWPPCFKYMTFDKMLHFVQPEFPHFQSRYRTHFIGLLE